jgi:hypothetical protein
VDTLLLSKVDSWITGVNTNVEGRKLRQTVLYVGRASDYRKRCDAVKRGEYAEFQFSPPR